MRDSLALAEQHVTIEKIEGMEDIDEVKEQFKNIVNGTQMTSKVMDKVLAKFEVTQFDPIGEAFDPNIHDAVFMIPESEHENNHVGQVM